MANDSFGAIFGRRMAARRAEVRMTQGQLAALVWPGDSNAEATRKGDISKLETGKVPNPQAQTVLRIARALGIEGEIDPLRKSAQMTAAQQLEVIPTLSRDQLELLASRFGITAPHDRSDADLRGLLTEKATDYRALKAAVEAIPETLRQLSNLKGAAKDAIERGDLDEVEEILERVHTVELEEAAKTAELRADNALLRGHVDDAYRILCAAADSFAAVDPLEPAWRRLDYAERLYQHGLRFGGPGLALAARMTQDALSRIDRNTQAWHWARAQNNLGNALQNQGTRTAGPDGAALLEQSVTAYRAALEVVTRQAHPVEWAATQNNLAIALSEQGTRTAGPEGAALLEQAVTAYRAALEVYTRQAHSVDWAMTQNNLGAALRNQGTRTAGPDGAALLAQAVTACRAALEVFTRQAHPVQWAMTQNNLGNALRNQGTRTAGPEGAALLEQAVVAYRAALEVRTRQAHPVQWAMTQNNLGVALSDQGTRTTGPDGAALLDQAVKALHAALEVRTRQAHPVDWAMTQGNLAIAHLEIARHDTCTAPLPPLRAALGHVDAALEMYDPVHMPYDHGTATTLRGRILAALAKAGA